MELVAESSFEESIDLMKEYDKNVPHIIKYMGSKRSILPFIINAIKDTYNEGTICDLFAGTSILSGALGKLIPMHSNDIQEYSAILSKTYLSSYDWNNNNILNEIIMNANDYRNQIINKNPNMSFVYYSNMNIEDFVELEEKQKSLIDKDFGDLSHHLFVKYYSGTYWSYEQCTWIDSLRKVADDYRDSSIYYLILSSLMHAMSYNSQSTGHYAQYRDATNNKSKDDILIYRLKEILPFFIFKFNQLKEFLGVNTLNHTVTSKDYEECLNEIEPGTLVYADPPYAFVHYSRFYHAIETLVKYDYPIVGHKGRYRVDRHQSPFCKSTEVKNAFKIMFEKIRDKNSSLILSYSNTGMIKLSDIISIANQCMGSKYEITYREEDYSHSTMGRKDDKSKQVQEYLIIAKLL